MTKYIFILLILFAFQSMAQQKSNSDSSATTLILSGIYAGKNIYVQNTLLDIVNQVYCTDSIVVNGRLYKTYVAQYLYEIKLDSIIKIQGTDVTIIIYHKKSCKPSILTPMKFPPIGSKFISFEIDSTGRVQIRTFNEPIVNGKKAPFHIDQYRALKWRTVLSIPQKYESENIYDTVIKLTPGKNMFQLSEYPYEYTPIMINVKSGIPETICTLDTLVNCISCSDTVYYLLEERNMHPLVRGYAKNIDVSKLDSGSYTLLYDNRQLLFDIKRRIK